MGSDSVDRSEATAAQRPPDQVPNRVPNRWWVLVVLCLSLLIVVMDNTIVNVAIPTLSRSLGASTSALQWIVSGYSLAFAGPLLAAGSLGDRKGRKSTLGFGLLAFAVTSLAGALATTSGELIAARCLMGLSAAFIMPVTLSVVIEVFDNPRERAFAIMLWSGVSGIGVALGPVLGGVLLADFWWGSIFVANVVLALVAYVLGRVVIPESRDRAATPGDLPGTVVSTAAVTLVIFALIQGPDWGWTSPWVLASFAGAVVALVAFGMWERRAAHPMFPLDLIRNARFNGGSIAVGGAFVGLAGFVFELTQYFQSVKSYSPLAAGVRTLPFAIGLIMVAPTAVIFVNRWGNKITTAAGLSGMGVGMFVAVPATAHSPYLLVLVSAFVVGASMGLVMGPATNAVMGSLPPQRAGVASASGDTVREMGAALGVAAIGSVGSMLYRSDLGRSASAAQLPAQALRAAKGSLAEALQVSGGVPDGRALAGDGVAGFMHGFHWAAGLAGAALFLTALAVLIVLPHRPLPEPQVPASAAEADLASAITVVVTEPNASRGAHDEDPVL